MDAIREGLVIAHLGQGIAVEYDGKTALCHPKRKLETVAVGDRVLWRISAPGQGSVEEILPRRSLLTRPSRNDKTRPVAANIDTVFVVFAPEPYCDFLLIDQYLALCENRNIDVALVFNKTDLNTEITLLNELALYERLGYPIFRVSTLQRQGLEKLEQTMFGRTSLLTGQSGVGKSSLTNALIPDKDLKINSICATTKHGRHTTTAATLYHLPSGGDLIDSPGVAIFGLDGLTESQLAHGYREFQPYIDHCRFVDCRHVDDKDCAVRLAAEQGDIPISRYRRFLKLREKLPRSS